MRILFQNSHKAIFFSKGKNFYLCTNSKQPERIKNFEEARKKNAKKINCLLYETKKFFNFVRQPKKKKTVKKIVFSNKILKLNFPIEHT